MPLDRPATVRLFTAGTREQGEYVPGPATDYSVWLTRIDSPAEREPNAEGARPVVQGRFRVRWFRELAGAAVELSHRLLIDGQEWRITGVDEVDARDVRGDEQRALRTRRRWLELTATRVEPA